MAIKRPNLSSLVSRQLPEFVREDYQTFVAFLEAYYEYMDAQPDSDLKTLRDIDTTLDSFIKQFRNELANNFPTPQIDEKFLLQHMKEHYFAKGSEASFKFLFRVLFNKDVTLDYPSKQMLRASDGRWNQDVSIFARVNAGDPDMIVGRVVDVVTPTRILRIQVDRRQYVEIEVNRVLEIAPNIYEFFIDRKYFGDIAVGDRLRYADIFDATILSTTSKVTLQQRGKNFKLGELYEVKNGQGAGSILKVSAVNEIGAITSLQFVKYGINYASDFTATLLPIGGVSATSAGSTALTIGGVAPNISINFNETTNGFFEQGTINKADYNTDAPGVSLFWDGTYAGETIREFYADNKYTILDPDEPAIIKVSLGPLAKYPGYYTSNLGFLDDAIYIQDSRYYQAFSYVIKIDERLESYRSLVKTLIHPSGMALFGEYDLRNEFDTGTSLEMLLRFLVFAYQDQFNATDVISAKDFGKALTDSFSTSDTTGINGTRTVPYYSLAKPLDTHYLNDGITEDVNQISLTDTTGEDEDRTFPYFGISKRINGTSYLYDGTTLDDNTVSPSEDDYLNADELTYRKGISEYSIEKILNSQQYNHYLNNGVTLDSDLINMSDTTGTNGARTMPYAEIEKPLGDHYLNDSWDLWIANTAVIVGHYLQAGGLIYQVTGAGTTNSVAPTHTSGEELNGTATLAYIGVEAEISDDNTVTMSDTTGINGARTVPYIVLNKSISATTLNYDEELDDESFTPTDSGGSLWLSPYADPYPITSSYFANDSGNYTTGESAFTG